MNGFPKALSTVSGIDIPPQAREELKRFNNVLARFPRFHFSSAFQVALLRRVFQVLALLPSPLTKLDLTALEEELSFANWSVRVRIIEPKVRPKAIVVDVHWGRLVHNAAHS